MRKPDGSKDGPQAHHYALHLAHSWHCEHTCGAHRPSAHRAGRGPGPHEHALPHFHANHAELLALPSKARTGQLALEMLAELKASEHLPPHLYSAIWTQVHHALLATGALPAEHQAFGPAQEA